MEFTPDKFQLPMLYARRDEMIRWLIEEKKFNPKAAPKCVDAFLKSMKYVLQENKETG